MINKFKKIEILKTRFLQLFYGWPPKINLTEYNLSKNNLIEIAEKELELGLLEEIIILEEKTTPFSPVVEDLVIGERVQELISEEGSNDIRSDDLSKEVDSE
jgi:hypothetical protein